LNHLDDERHTLEELLTLYEVEPEIRDVIVEGRSDAAMVRWYLDSHGVNCRVYAIDDRVELGSDLVLQHDQEVGAKGRVVTLAVEASQAGVGSQLTCIADADSDRLLERTLSSEHLIYTDYGSVECYCLNTRTLDKFLRLVIGAPQEVSAESVLEAVLICLSDIFTVRASMKSVAPECAVLKKFVKCIKRTPSGLSLDVKDLIRRSLGGGDEAAFAAVLASYEQLSARRVTDPRESVRGHDIAPVLILHLRINSGGLTDPDAFEKALMGCLEVDLLDTEEAFMRLRRRVTTSAAA
jgi:hypothetical protein